MVGAQSTVILMDLVIHAAGRLRGKNNQKSRGRRGIAITFGTHICDMAKQVTILLVLGKRTEICQERVGCPTPQQIYGKFHLRTPPTFVEDGKPRYKQCKRSKSAVMPKISEARICLMSHGPPCCKPPSRRRSPSTMFVAHSPSHRCPTLRFESCALLRRRLSAPWPRADRGLPRRTG